MHITHLSVTNFRCLARLEMDVPRRVILLLGGNAQGKTSVQEAIFFLSCFTSFHTSVDRQLINSQAVKEAEKANRDPKSREDEKRVVAKISAHFRDDSRSRKIEVRLILEPVGFNSQRIRKEVLVDGVKKQISEAAGYFKAVLFIPQMSQIIEGGPEERRRYLNLALTQVFPGYARTLSDYNKALDQRNALLKNLAESGGEVSQLEAWDKLLAEPGAKLIYWRNQALQEIEKQAARIHHRLTRGDEVLRISYEPAYDPIQEPDGQLSLRIKTSMDRSGVEREEIENGFRERLGKLRREEIQRGMTTTGPHRDEIRFLANGVDLGDYGSRGQVRTTLLALKLAEVEWIRSRTGQAPVLLLDEVMAELDPQRRTDLLGYVDGLEQALLTTTDQKLFSKDFIKTAQIWEVKAGMVNQTEIK